VKESETAGINKVPKQEKACPRAVRFLKSLRGGAQAQLLTADDGRHYVTKFLDNPQHRRILVNEWLCARILNYLRLSTPKTSIVEVGAEMIAREPQMAIHLAKSRQPVKPGRHYGSAYPGHPGQQAVFDFLPDDVLRRVVNLRDFCGALVVDKWTGNADARQAIFFLARLRDWIPGATGNQKGHVMQLVDHGFAFDGEHWEIMDSPLQGLYPRVLVYEDVTGLESFEPWLSRVGSFPAEVLYAAVGELPPEWIAGDEAAVNRLLERLLARRGRVAGQLEAVALGPKCPFPNWGTNLAAPKMAKKRSARRAPLVAPVLVN
jgi:hypothetical protein